MSDTRRHDLKKSSFAEFLAREDVRAVLSANYSKQGDEGISRIFNNVPPKNTVYEFLRPILNLCQFNASLNHDNPELEDITEESIPSSIKFDINVWVDLVCATAIFDLFDNENNLRPDILDALQGFDLSKYDQDEIKKRLFLSYLLIAGQHSYLIYFDIDDEKNTKINSYINYAFDALNRRRLEIERNSAPLSLAFCKNIRLSLYTALQDDQLSFRFAFEIEKLLFSYNYEYCEYLRTKFYDVRERFTDHLKTITPIEQMAKNNVLVIVDDIIENSQHNSIHTQVKKLKMLSEVLEQTQAYTPNADEQAHKAYSSLIKEVSKHAWGKRLGSAMTSVPIAVLLASFIVLSLATGGTAIPFLAGAAFTYLLAATIFTALAATAATALNLYTLWNGFKHKPIADAMKGVRDNGKEEIDGKSSISEATIMAKL